MSSTQAPEDGQTDGLAGVFRADGQHAEAARRRGRRPDEQERHLAVCPMPRGGGGVGEQDRGVGRDGGAERGRGESGGQARPRQLARHGASGGWQRER